jgi:hypothetical protein
MQGTDAQTQLTLVLRVLSCVEPASTSNYETPATGSVMIKGHTLAERENNAILVLDSEPGLPDANWLPHEHHTP